MTRRRRAFQRVGKIKEEPGAHEVPHAEMAKRALTRLESGGAVARPHAEVLAQELAGALRRRDGRALRRLASPSHFAVGLGGHFHFADPTRPSIGSSPTSWAPRCAATRAR